MNIIEALSKLDHENDQHWTGDGAPLVNVVSDLVGRAVTRKEIIDASPTFARGVAHVPNQQPETMPQKREGDEDGGEAGLTSDPVDPIGSPAHPLQARADELLASSASMDREIADLKKRKEVVDREHAALTERIDREGPAQDQLHRDTIGGYLRSQAKIRQDRRARVDAILPSGVSAGDVVKALDPRSRIDAAMHGRKMPLGAGRPTRPPMARE